MATPAAFCPAVAVMAAARTRAVIVEVSFAFKSRSPLDLTKLLSINEWVDGNTTLVDSAPPPLKEIAVVLLAAKANETAVDRAVMMDLLSL